VVWWAVVAVGQWPLFRLPLPSVLVLLLVPVMLGAPRGHALIHLLIGLVIAGAGAVLGVLIGRTTQDTKPAT
jgi:lipopolysaccharide export LptBFGC system permease protein LptF